MKVEYGISFILFALVALGLLFLFSSSAPMNSSYSPVESEPYKEIVNPSGFVNTDSVVIEELIGKKVILIDFLTYSCINCQRTFPYLNSWYEEYKDQGLEIIGIHTPEFAFERDIENVRKAMQKFNIVHPIVLDNEYATWRAYGNQYWPRKYLIDIHGNIVYDHIGEGGYVETEMRIQEALAERARVLGLQDDTQKELVSASVNQKANYAQSPETYFGSLRNEYFKNGVAGKVEVQDLTVPRTITRNALYLGGVWDIQPEYAESINEATVVYRYSAKEVYIVAESEEPVVIEVYQDGVLVDEFAGESVTDNGRMLVNESQLYKVINNAAAGEHTLELRIQKAGVRLFAFTFG
ncbi:thiol-disulfide isomerase [Candidatus Kaiserbacteria bacterium CG10_big_fil_rev_8_21_14_0_10_45_20]|uniref:Thiol-disulfide isomerase n=1 Tax=Candidatus Kaiserbacteria bacterium CG10_big_fil_rev_8_21_14_0_10_45_20 TaxID=1974607 RepID=A0A2H0UG03_9BACT|nr:MAG: thiol-disulfide isomerase [Candidatus Kaiserbacteria bacterium CG10_big_fil_rev_8_21_14_0_10_45_20]